MHMMDELIECTDSNDSLHVCIWMAATDSSVDRAKQLRGPWYDWYILWNGLVIYLGTKQVPYLMYLSWQ